MWKFASLGYVWAMDPRAALCAFFIKRLDKVIKAMI